MGEAPEAFRLVQTVEDAATIEIENATGWPISRKRRSP